MKFLQTLVRHGSTIAGEIYPAIHQAHQALTTAATEHTLGQAGQWTSAQLNAVWTLVAQGGSKLSSRTISKLTSDLEATKPGTGAGNEILACAESLLQAQKQAAQSQTKN